MSSARWRIPLPFLDDDLGGGDLAEGSGDACAESLVVCQRRRPLRVREGNQEAAKICIGRIIATPEQAHMGWVPATCRA
jgi:hypothetical protein